MKNRFKKKRTTSVVEVEKHVASLESHINIEVSRQGYFRITPKFYHKSGTELRLEESQRTKLITI